MEKGLSRFFSIIIVAVGFAFRGSAVFSALFGDIIREVHEEIQLGVVWERAVHVFDIANR